MKLEGNKGTLEINILRRSNSESEDYWDANWLESEIRLVVPGFNTLYGTNLRVDDLQRFYERLNALKHRITKKAEFTTMEEGLYLDCQLDDNGIVNCKGLANNNNGNSLAFDLQADLASLDIFANELNTVLKSYPLVGKLE